MSVSVTWYGHSNFKVSCGDVTVFIDPFFTHNPSCPVTWNEAGKPDLVLVTHDHGDHTGDARGRSAKAAAQPAAASSVRPNA